MAEETETSSPKMDVTEEVKDMAQSAEPATASTTTTETDAPTTNAPDGIANENNKDGAVPTATEESNTTASTATSTKVTTSNETFDVAAVEDDNGPTGCYLVYEPSSGGRLMLHYSQGPVPENAVGFWLPGEGQSIQGFKFKQAAGRSELIKGIAGGDANRRKYLTGWCLFLKAAKAKQGKVIQFSPGQGVPVDVYAYIQSSSHPEFLDLESGLIDISAYDAVAVVPRHHEFLKGVKTLTAQTFLEMGSIAGATTLLTT